MPKISVASSQDRLDVFNAAVRQLIRLGRVRDDVTADPTPYQVWLLDAEDLRRPDPIQFAYQAGWRYFAWGPSSPRTVVAADIAGGTQPMLLNISYGSAVASEYEQAKRAQSLERMTGASFSVRALRVPGALVQAIWAKPESAADAGQLLPFGKSFVDMGAERLHYPTNDFLQKVHPTSIIPRTKGLRPE